MKLMNKYNFNVAFAASTEQSRHTLRGILATENETVATDGHILARVSTPTMNAERFPSVEGFKPNGFTRAIIPLDAAKEIARAIPKNKTIPVLEHAAVSSETIDEKQILKIAVTDLDTPRVFTVKPLTGQFPSYDMLFKNTAPKVDITFNAELLERMAKAAKRFSSADNSPIRIRIWDANSALRFDVVNYDGQEMNGLVMPMRASVNPTFRPIEQPKHDEDTDENRSQR